MIRFEVGMSKIYLLELAVGFIDDICLHLAPWSCLLTIQGASRRIHAGSGVWRHRSRSLAVLRKLCRGRGFGGKQRDEPFEQGGVNKDGVSQSRVRETRKHRDLDGRHDFTSIYPESHEAQNAITADLH